MVDEKPQVENEVDKLVEQQEANSELAKEETPEEINWKKFREERKKDREARRKEEQQRLEAEKQRNELRELVQSLSNSPERNLSDKDVKEVLQSIPLDELVTGKDVKTYTESEVKKQVEKTVLSFLEKQEKDREEKKRQEEKQKVPERLKADYNDFYEIVNEDTLDRLEYEHPELAETLKELPEGYSKWVRVYKAIKRYQPGVNDRLKNENRYEKNQNKPRSASTPGYVPATKEQPRILTSEQKRANWERMQRQLKGLA